MDESQSPLCPGLDTCLMIRSVLPLVCCWLFFFFFIRIWYSTKTTPLARTRAPCLGAVEV